MMTSIGSRAGASSVLLVGLLLLGLLVGLGLGTSRARADDVAEATALFQSGNEHFQRGMRLRGPRRQHELEAALEQYFASLARVRSRNVLYNTALVLEALERAPEAFNHWSEYVAVQGLSEQELADGRQHRDALRPRVAVFVVESDADAEVWIDRRDLGSRGHTPLEIALDPGEHAFFLAAAGRREAEGRASASLGETARLRVSLELLPVWVQVLAPEGAVLEVDGARVSPGQSMPVPPGPHLARVSTGERVLAERRFEVLPGSAPMVIDMTSALGAGGLGGGVVEVVVDASARIEIDGVLSGQGEHATATLSAGPHHVRVTASGRRAYEGNPTFDAFPSRFEVTLGHGADGGIYAGRGTFGALAILGLITSGVGLALAAGAHEENQRLGTQGSADTLRTLTIFTDVSWSLTAAFGGAAILFLALDAGGSESAARFTVEPTPGGATLSLRGSLGGAL